MTTAYVVTGTLTGGRTVELDESLPAAGKVRVTVEVVAPAPPKQSLGEWLDDLRQRQAARGHVPRSREEIDAQIREERESWD
jgi:hypothetical protein